ncbi:hypothetical protein [Alkalihalobacillus sp. AL-G]|uniref:hypothetical protein n=1 Tax=Alkalihalobacillus sp. AL-G TaxID=2926399 RepID=UPI00272BFFE7|nr:hypothetical protein [Alkalihalobacillus sp. AL-G]WLD93282.1 hypothetical protein MOJ78_20180 [Alkalihalobacillus sp. AL-G]
MILILKVFQKIVLMICSLLMILIIPATAFLLAIQQSILKPYHTLDYVENSGIYEELQQTIPETIKQDQSFQKVQSDPGISDVVDQVLAEQINVERISVVVDFIHNELWDYVVGKDEVLDKLEISDIRSAILVEARTSEILADDTIYSEKFVSAIDWAAFYKLDQKKMDTAQTYYNRLISIIIWNGIVLVILIGLSFLVTSNSRFVLKMLSSVCFISFGILFVLLIAVELIGVSRLTGIFDFPQQFSGLEDNLIGVIHTAFIDFVSKLIAFTGVVLLAGYGLFLCYYRLESKGKADIKKQRVEIEMTTKSELSL